MVFLHLNKEAIIGDVVLVNEAILGRVHKIDTFGAVDGPGNRFVVFLQGCPLKCLYCHNPDTWNFGGGKEMTAGEIIKDFESCMKYIDGITLSGGEPLLQIDFALTLIRGAKKLKLHTAIDTSAAVSLEKCKIVVDEVDMLLLDVKTADADFYKELTGGRIDTVIEMLDYCESIGKPIWVRHVVIPGLTLDDKKLERVATLVSKYSCVKYVELLPFHKMGETKWEAEGMKYSLAETNPPSEEEMERAAVILRKKGLHVFVSKL